jgi:2'-5' RNA ligase
VARWVRIFDGYQGPAWTAENIELISSRLGQGPSHGAAYDTVGEWSFLG